MWGKLFFLPERDCDVRIFSIANLSSADLHA